MFDAIHKAAGALGAFVDVDLAAQPDHASLIRNLEAAPVVWERLRPTPHS